MKRSVIKVLIPASGGSKYSKATQLLPFLVRKAFRRVSTMQASLDRTQSVRHRPAPLTLNGHSSFKAFCSLTSDPIAPLAPTTPQPRKADKSIRRRASSEGLGTEHQFSNARFDIPRSVWSITGPEQPRGFATIKGSSNHARQPALEDSKGESSRSPSKSLEKGRERPRTANLPVSAPPSSNRVMNKINNCIAILEEALRETYDDDDEKSFSQTPTGKIGGLTLLQKPRDSHHLLTAPTTLARNLSPLASQSSAVVTLPPTSDCQQADVSAQTVEFVDIRHVRPPVIVTARRECVKLSTAKLIQSRSESPKQNVNKSPKGSVESLRQRTPSIEASPVSTLSSRSKSKLHLSVHGLQLQGAESGRQSEADEMLTVSPASLSVYGDASPSRSAKSARRMLVCASFQPEDLAHQLQLISEATGRGDDDHLVEASREPPAESRRGSESFKGLLSTPPTVLTPGQSEADEQKSEPPLPEGRTEVKAAEPKLPQDPTSEFGKEDQAKQIKKGRRMSVSFRGLTGSRSTSGNEASGPLLQVGKSLRHSASWSNINRVMGRGRQTEHESDGEGAESPSITSAIPGWLRKSRITPQGTKRVKKLDKFFGESIPDFELHRQESLISRSIASRTAGSRQDLDDDDQDISPALLEDEDNHLAHGMHRIIERKSFANIMSSTRGSVDQLSRCTSPEVCKEPASITSLNVLRAGAFGPPTSQSITFSLPSAPSDSGFAEAPQSGAWDAVKRNVLPPRNAASQWHSFDQARNDSSNDLTPALSWGIGSSGDTSESPRTSLPTRSLFRKPSFNRLPKSATTESYSHDNGLSLASSPSRTRSGSLESGRHLSRRTNHLSIQDVWKGNRNASTLTLVSPVKKLSPYEEQEAGPMSLSVPTLDQVTPPESEGGPERRSKTFRPKLELDTSSMSRNRSSARWWSRKSVPTTPKKKRANTGEISSAEQERAIVSL